VAQFSPLLMEFTIRAHNRHAPWSLRQRPSSTKDKIAGPAAVRKSRLATSKARSVKALYRQSHADDPYRPGRPHACQPVGTPEIVSAHG